MDIKGKRGSGKIPSKDMRLSGDATWQEIRTQKAWWKSKESLVMLQKENLKANISFITVHIQCPNTYKIRGLII